MERAKIPLFLVSKIIGKTKGKLLIWNELLKTIQGVVSQETVGSVGGEGGKKPDSLVLSTRLMM